MKEPVGNIDGVGARSEGGSSSMSRGGDEGGEVQLKKGPWSAEEDAMLIDHVSKYGERNWNAVHELTGLPRCGKSCRVRWTTYLRPNAKEGAFSAEEDRIIDELDDQISASNDDEGGGGDLKKGPWTAAEDAVLMEYVNKHGEGNWNALQKRSVLARCGKSCRLRWTNHLRPNLKKGNFSAEEERIIVEMHAQFGNKWARMAARLPGRTDNDIKNFWNTRTKRLLRHRLPLYPPEILQQNQPSPQHNNGSKKSHSLPSTPASSFTFPTTQLLSPNTPTTPQNNLTSPARTLTPPATPVALRPSPPPLTPPPVSPLSSPSTAYFPTLPLFDFSLPRTPPILQIPSRIRNFSRSSSATSPNNNTTVNTTPTLHNITVPTSCFSLPSSPFPTTISPSNTSPLSYEIPCCFTNLLCRNNSEFHKEIERENEKLCLLLASVTKTDRPPLAQMLSPTSLDWNSASSSIPAAAAATNTTTMPAKIGRTRIRRMKNVTNSGKGKRNSKGFGATESSRNGLLQNDLLQEVTAVLEVNEKDTSTKQGHLIFEDAQQNPKEIMFDDFCGIQYSDLSSSLSLSSELTPTDGEVAGQLNSSMTEDLTKLLDIFPSSPLQLSDMYTDDISNGQASVIIDDNNMDIDMQQQIALLFPTTVTDQGSRTVGTGSWDSLPRIY
ncbi:hypothetical protein OIU85_004069 [Salix viminalis]|uniref:MYB family protein n=1 Tax=Salix viminalis TaxID=40686 RepID=A0A9Q0PRV0_SALVM|nr:hypothetical protein OIU85_004069 [Salix viminalis]